jgi:hypothetical protein
MRQFTDRYIDSVELFQQSPF